MIRNVVLHLTGDQPLVCDLPALPRGGDSCLLCTNLRTPDGKRPVFIDAVESTFVIPLLHVRFIEIPAGAEGMPTSAPALSAGTGTPAATAPTEESDDLDEDFLRRVREV